MSLYQPTSKQQVSRLPSLDVGDRVTVLSPEPLAGTVETVTRLLAVKRERGQLVQWFVVLAPSGRVVPWRSVRKEGDRG